MMCLTESGAMEFPIHALCILVRVLFNDRLESFSTVLFQLLSTLDALQIDITLK